MLIRGVLTFALFLIPWAANEFVTHFPDIAQITIGSILVMIANAIAFFIKKKIAMKKGKL